MPNPSNDSSSVLTKSNRQQSELINDVSDRDRQLAPKQDSQDWYYGTEELLDALPRVWTRSVLYLTIGFTAIVLPWSMIAKVDETGTATGRIEPKGATQRLDAAAPGNVVAVKVREGETVKAGQLLVELESDVLRTDLQQAQTRLEGQQNRLAQLDLMKNQMMLSINVQEQQNRSQELEKQSQVQQAQQELDANQSAYNVQKLEKQAQVDRAKQNINATETDYQLRKNRLSIDEKEIERYRELEQMGVVAQVQVVEMQKAADETRRLMLEAESGMKQAKLSLQEQQSNYQGIINQALTDIEQAKLRLQEQQNSYQSLIHTGRLNLLQSQEQLKDLQAQITTLKSEMAQSQSQIKSYKLQLAQRLVRSPINGTVFQLPIEKPGTVVQPGQMVAQVAPKGTATILKAQMTSDQSGFVRVGMPVKIKFDAYPFQDYGVVEGRVTWISPDTKVQETNSGNVETYELEIALEQPYIQTGNKQIALTPGQTATAEVVIRQRRVIDFILDPFKKLQKGGLEM